MVYKTATQKILIYLFIATLAITIISGADYWMMWSILPISFFLLWLVGKLPIQEYRAFTLKLCDIISRDIEREKVNNIVCRRDVHGRVSVQIRAHLR